MLQYNAVRAHTCLAPCIRARTPSAIRVGAYTLDNQSAAAAEPDQRRTFTATATLPCTHLECERLPLRLEGCSGSAP